MRLLTFLRKSKTEEPAPVEAAAPAPTEVPTDPTAGSAGPARKRRRGSRGGRGRRKPSEQRPETQGEVAPAEPKQAVSQRKQAPQERKPSSQRKERAASRRRTPPRRPPLPAAKRELLVSVDVGEQRVAVIEDEKVAEVYLERPEKRSIAGNIYLGTVDNVLPGMEAAFIEIGLEKNGFLYVDEIVTPELEGKRHGKKIQDLISRGQEVLVQAVKDPMKSKGARLTTEISLPGRFVVFVPNGEGLGVSRRLPDDERLRLRDILKGLKVPKGGVIIRTAAEGASAEDIERDLVFLQRLWRSIDTRAKKEKAPALVYQEAELPLRVTRDLFTGDFERALVDNDRAYKRIVGYLKKTSPHMVERVVRYKDKTPLMEASGVDAEIRSTLSRRVDLPSGGYLVFDYAEAFTVIDVNTGRFVGGRGKNANSRLEDTITKNNLEAVKEVVRQLRLRDIGGIIVIDFIDMGNPKNRATVEEALRTEFERDRTKTYVVEISPLGLVEMTRQNVTDGPREILTKKCATCGGDGIVLSEASAAVDIERRLRALAAGSKAKAFKVELSTKAANILIGPGASRLAEIETQTKRRFYIDVKDGAHADHFLVLAEGTVEKLTPEAPVSEGSDVEVKLVEVGLHDAHTAVGKLGSYPVVVADAAKLVGRKVKVRVERVFAGSAYATLVEAPARPEPPITAEGEAEKPTRKPRARKTTETASEAVEPEAVEPDASEPESAEAVEDVAEAEVEDETLDVVGDDADVDGDAAVTPKKRTRRGSRGGRGRKKKPEAPEVAGDGPATEAVVPEPTEAGQAQADAARIHVPGRDLGRNGEEADAETDAAAEQAPKKRSRRGTRGGRNRKKKTPAENGVVADGEPAAEPAAAPESDFDYVPMSQWEDEIRA